MQDALAQWWHTEISFNSGATLRLCLILFIVAFTRTMQNIASAWSWGTLRQRIKIVHIEAVCHTLRTRICQCTVRLCGLFSGTPPFHSVPRTVGPFPLLPPPTFYYVFCTLQTLFYTLSLYTPCTKALVLKWKHTYTHTYTHIYTSPSIFRCSCLHLSQFAFSPSLSDKAETLLKCAHDN